MIDLHCHILPAVDDGPDDIDGSLELARAAANAGTRTIAATPHIREDYPFEHSSLTGRVDQLNLTLERAGIEVEVVRGGEVAISMLPSLDDDALRDLCLGGGPYLLVESPYTHATDLLEGDIFALQVRGFRVLLAHPERSPSFLSDRARLAGLVSRGVLCSVTSASLTGRFGSSVRRFAVDMLREGLVHDVASDAHDAHHREPDIAAGLRAVANDLRRAVDHASWFTEDAPRAILAGDDPGPPPQLARGGVPRLPRLRRRRGSSP